MGVGALVGGLFGLASAGIAAHSASKVQAANAAAQSDINHETRVFNREEAEKARSWEAAQAEIDRAFNASQALEARKFNAQQSIDLMNFDAQQSYLTRLFNREEAGKARAFDAQQSLLAREFEERMSSTAHQREVSDLKAAGLNPILSGMGGSGSSTPVAPIIGGPAASSSAVSAGLASGPAASHNTPGTLAASVSGLSAYQRKNIMAEFVSSARDALKLSIEYEKAKVADKNAEAAHKQADASLKNAETAEKAQGAQERKINAEISSINNSIAIALEDLDIRKELKNASVDEKHAMIDKLMSDIDLNREQAAKIGIEKEELERRIRYGTFLSSYLPLEAREIVGNHMIDFVRENKGAIDFFMNNMNGKYELDDSVKSKRLVEKVLDWCVSKGWLTKEPGK